MKRKLIPIKATKLNVDIKKNHIVYDTDVKAGPGVVLTNDQAGVFDMLLCNQFHEGGEVKLYFKPVKIPARRYEVGDQLGFLLELE